MVDSLLHGAVIFFLKDHHLCIVEHSNVVCFSLDDLLIRNLYLLEILNFFYEVHFLDFLGLRLLDTLLIHHFLVIGFSGKGMRV